MTKTLPDTEPTETTPDLLRRFERSMVMDFEKWHDGTGYDLDALRAMSPTEKLSAEALVLRIHGKAPEPFDMAQRPFFLRFNTEDPGERETMYLELCEKIGVAAGRQGQMPAGTAPLLVANTEYTVTVDYRGEMLTYCEPNRSAHVDCIFDKVPRIKSGTLSDWYYPLGRRREKMTVDEQETVLARIANYCGKHHGMSEMKFET